MDLPESLAGSPATKMYLWDQAEEGSLGTLLNSEEQILNSMFEACDPQRTGFVAVTHILAYLEAMTGRSPQDTRLQTLAHSLDPNGEGPQATVDLHTFLVIMRDWIAACQLDGGLELEEETAFEGALTPQHLPSGCPEESANLESFGGEDPRPELPATADLLSSLEDLELSNRRLAGENAKLQRSVETAEEGSARLGEEITALRKQLRSTQQALQFAKAVDEELEDLKSLAKSLEEQNRSLLAQARQTEKEQQHLVAEIETLPVPLAPPAAQGRSAPADPGTSLGPAAAAAALYPAPGPVPTPHLAPPPALLPPAPTGVSRAPHPSAQCLVQ
uniref:Protein KASH5 n=1 Tax=Rousettus aegyptiacus TaxID=9407 RepID=A0A7J8CEG5_ROUAE|nr:hypothetical protein HJG63_002223 [Rousettus aegyptiacus]